MIYFIILTPIAGQFLKQFSNISRNVIYKANSEAVTLTQGYYLSKYKICINFIKIQKIVINIATFGPN